MDANAGLGARVELAHAQLDLAQALGDGTEAAQLIERAQACAVEHDLGKVTRRLGDLRLV